MKTREEILSSKSIQEVIEWLKNTPQPHDIDVVGHLNYLARKNLESSVPEYDKDAHYDFL